MKSKTIILSSPEHNPRSPRGILTLNEEDFSINCKLRTYNLNPLPPNTKIGLYCNNQVLTENLINHSGFYSVNFSKKINLNNDFYVAILDNSKNVILSGGTYVGFFFENSQPETQQSPQETCQNNCENCKYKEFFYSQNVNQLSPEPQTETTNQTPNSIISSIVPQFDYIFQSYPENKELTALIENAKFVEIKEDNKSYSLGAIYENSQMRYICYAVKTQYNSPAPEELGKFHQWLPLDPEDPLSEGYHIVFQDAQDLKIIEV